MEILKNLGFSGLGNGCVRRRRLEEALVRMNTDAEIKIQTKRRIKSPAVYSSKIQLPDQAI
jgi:hypothetical protein